MRIQGFSAGLFASIVAGAMACREPAIEKTLWVGAERVPCGMAGPPECLRVSEDPAAGWTLLRGEINGFAYEEGNAYELRVRQRRASAAPAAVLEGAQLELIEVVRETREEGPDAPAASSAEASAKLEDRTWFLISDDPMKGETAPEGARRTWVRFHAERLTGLAGCNRFFGRYEVTGDRISVGNVATTNRACDAALMEHQRAHLDALQAAQSFAIKDEILQIATADGRVFRFEERAARERIPALAKATPAAAATPAATVSPR
jgi:heat shock protein HslJ